MNRDGVDPNNPFDLGTAIYDTSFDIGDESCQQHLLDVSEELLSTSVELVVTNSDGFEVSGTTLVMPAFRDWAARRGYRFPIPRTLNITALMGEFVLENSRYDSYVGLSFRPPRVLFIRSVVRSTLLPSTSSFDVVDVHAEWEEFIASLSEDAPISAGEMMFSANVFPRAFTEVLAVEGIKISIIVAGAVAFVSILMFTLNLIVTAVTVLSILANLFAMLGLFWVLGWDLGVIEAVSVSILIGLNIDYALHACEAYVTSSHVGRKPRIVFGMTHVGVSIVSACVTTSVAVSMLMFCEIVLFRHFGTIVVINTVLSVFFTVFFLSSLLAAIGPNDKFGSIPAMFRCCMGKKE